ncbi:MAG: hypothetical protein KDE19_15555, partial [Caldilineaceae bacterium]|nr:hypothetical protein [Caldilineaceae bacterium]
MSGKRTSRGLWQGLGCAGLLLLALLFYQWSTGSAVGASSAAPADAERVAQVWNNVRNSQRYAFSANVESKSIPLPTAGNIGRFSKTDSLYVEGSNDLEQSSLQMALWGGGISVADRSNAYQVRVQDGTYQTRVGEGEWQTSRDQAVAFAPEGNFLAFLEMAKNIRLEESPLLASPKGGGTVTGGEVGFGQQIAPADETVPSLSGRAREGRSLTRFTFDIDSQSYAQKLARLSQQQLVRSGELPAG